MILIKDDDENISIDKILSVLSTKDSIRNTFYHFAIRVVDSTMRKIEYYNDIDIAELENILKETSSKYMRETDLAECIRNKFVIITGDIKDQIKILPISAKNYEKRGATYNKVLAYYGKFKLPDSNNAFMDHFVNFIGRYTSDEIATFIRVKKQRIEKPHEINYWDFLINDDDDNLALISFDSTMNELIPLSDNFAETKECSSLKIGVIKEKTPIQLLNNTPKQLYGEELLFNYENMD